MTYVEAVRTALADGMREDPSVVLLGEDIGEYGGVFRATEGLRDEFGPIRVKDTPISESGFVGCALGAAMTGLRPVVEIMFFDFVFVAMDQLLNQIAKITAMSGGQVRVPLVIRTQGGDYRGTGAQHGQCLEAIFTHVPGFKVVVPSNPADAYGLLRTAIRDADPVLFVEHKGLYGTTGEIGDAALPFGKARVVRPGSAATLISYGYGVTLCEQAADRLASEEISVEILDLRTLTPLDFAAIAESVAKTHRAVVVHEAHRTAGFGAEIAARISDELFDHLDAPVKRVAAKDVPLPYAASLERAVLPQVDDVLRAVREVV